MNHPKGYTNRRCADCGKSFPSKSGHVRCNPCFRDLANKPPEFFKALASACPPIPAITFPPEFQQRVLLCESWLDAAKLWPTLKLQIASKEVIDSIEQSIQAAQTYNALAVKYLHSIERLLDCNNRKDAWLVYEEIEEARKPLEKKGRRVRNGHLSNVARKFIALHYNLLVSPDPPTELLDLYSIPYPSDGSALSASMVTQCMADYWSISYNQFADMLHGMRDNISDPLPSKGSPPQKAKNEARDKKIKKYFDGSSKSVAQLAAQHGLSKRRIRQIAFK